MQHNNDPAAPNHGRRYAHMHGLGSYGWILLLRGLHDLLADTSTYTSFVGAQLGSAYRVWQAYACDDVIWGRGMGKKKKTEKAEVVCTDVGMVDTGCWSWGEEGVGMCVCMYVCMYVCVCVCMCVCG